MPETSCEPSKLQPRPLSPRSLALFCALRSPCFAFIQVSGQRPFHSSPQRDPDFLLRLHEEMVLSFNELNKYPDTPFSAPEGNTRKDLLTGVSFYTLFLLFRCGWWCHACDLQREARLETQRSASVFLDVRTCSWRAYRKKRLQVPPLVSRTHPRGLQLSREERENEKQREGTGACTCT